MAEAYSWEVRETAKELYITGSTYEQVAEETGVSLSQLKRWGAEEDWTGAKKEYREALSSIKVDTVKLRAGLVKKALENFDPQSVYAFAALEKASGGQGKKQGEPALNPEQLKDIKTPADAIAALSEAIELKINRMLSQPDTLQPSQVKETEQLMGLIDRMKAKYNPDQGPEVSEGGLSDEAAEMIRKQILGVTGS